MSWNLEKIQALLTDQVEENIHLDYNPALKLSQKGIELPFRACSKRGILRWGIFAVRGVLRK